MSSIQQQILLDWIIANENNLISFGTGAKMEPYAGRGSINFLQNELLLQIVIQDQTLLILKVKSLNKNLFKVEFFYFFHGLPEAGSH